MMAVVVLRNVLGPRIFCTLGMIINLHRPCRVTCMLIVYFLKVHGNSAIFVPSTSFLRPTLVSTVVASKFPLLLRDHFGLILDSILGKSRRNCLIFERILVVFVVPSENSSMLVSRRLQALVFRRTYVVSTTYLYYQGRHTPSVYPW